MLQTISTKGKYLNGDIVVYGAQIFASYVQFHYSSSDKRTFTYYTDETASQSPHPTYNTYYIKIDLNFHPKIFSYTQFTWTGSTSYNATIDDKGTFRTTGKSTSLNIGGSYNSFLDWIIDDRIIDGTTLYLPCFGREIAANVVVAGYY